MTNLGGFSEEALLLYQLAAFDKAYEFSEEEGETYDFTRCMRPDGTFYGTSGTCKKGSSAGSKASVKPTTPKGKKPRATSSQLKESQAKLFDDAKAKHAAAKAAEKAFKQVERETKGDKSPEARKKRLEAGRAWDKAATAADTAQRKWMKEHERWSKASGREERAKMSPAQRAEARRVDKIIKERG